ncbi:uncharacterized protein BDV17DRAFT_251193 [Aspergillus undulatus]|uniref:uncharacterized protein n=1 Tax=Aspergillus undulatus TaxID=1810928 RepID=UPI003CCE0B43
MELEVSMDNEQQFWNNIQEIVSVPCSTEDLIDNALRAYLSLSARYKEEYLPSEFEVTRCSFLLSSSAVFITHTDYVRRQMIYALLQEDDPVTLHIIASFLLFDGRQSEVPFQMLNEEGAFPRLLELLQAQAPHMEDDIAAGLHRLLMDLLYELSRIQKIRVEDLILVDDEFVRGLFNIIEHLSYDANDPYHYPVIRVLLVLNEQFMISANNPDEQLPSIPLTNKVIKVLSVYGNSYKTFGENIILLINREAETSLQLLTLKLLYLIFTTPSTYEYFFTNDLHVLVDILIRNLLDLPEEASALRHTYLRVLYPLLAHTQLRLPPYYKRDELKRTLSLLVRGQLTGDTAADCERITHFDEVDETTRRLVLRCAAVEWLHDEPEPYKSERTPQREDSLISSLPTIDSALLSDADIGTPLESSQSMDSPATRPSSFENLASPSFDGQDSPTSADETPRKHSLAERLGMHLEPASTSSTSVHEIASQREKPGVITPSRHDGPPVEVQTSPAKHKVKPLPPKTRRWRGRRATVAGDDGSTSPVTPASIAEEGNTSPSPLSSTPVLTTSSPQLSPADSERRNSASATTAPTQHTSIPPPPTSHNHPISTRRSASNPPPAVPPPRRSAAAIHAHLTTASTSASSHCTPVVSPSRVTTPIPPVPPIPTHLQGRSQNHVCHSHGQTGYQMQKQAVKPEPPRTRRWGRSRKHTLTDSSDSHTHGANSVSGGGSIVPPVPLLHPEFSFEAEHASASASTSTGESAGENQNQKFAGEETSTNGHGHGTGVISVEQAVKNVSLH